MIENNNARGLVFNIQKYSVHDGPGIRTIVFTKGCGLRCRWCSNPESQHREPELAYNQGRCLGTDKCTRCFKACPNGALSRREDGFVAIDRSKCVGCKDMPCAEACPAQGIIVYGKPYTVAEALKVAQEDAMFYARSGGGMTISGGEPLLQSEFALNLLRLARERRVKTCIETCGLVPTDVVREAAQYLNYVLFDIKHMDPEVHKKHTGMPNDLILKNFQTLVTEFPDLPITARTPVIPGFNDHGPDIKAICDYASTKGIGVWLYVNQRALVQQIDRLLPLYKEWGIKGIKFGFVQVGNQFWTIWLHKAVRQCADYGIMVDIHDEYRPTGVSRTLPHLMTQEGIAGNETMPDARHNTILPFTRFLCGPADYTPCYFNARVKNTHAHQLAMPVVYYSPVTFLYWYDTPSLYQGEKELEFWKNVPTTWDETYPIDGEPGEYIAMARRSGEKWFVGVMNGLEARKLSLSTEFLQRGKRYMVTLYEDDPHLDTRTKVAIKQKVIKGGQILNIQLQASGGTAMEIKEAHRE